MDNVKFVFILLLEYILLYGDGSLGGGLQCVSLVTKWQWRYGIYFEAFLFICRNYKII